MNFLYVAIGSAVGGMLRYLVSLIRSGPLPFPYWTFSVNLLGSFAIGILAAVLPADSLRARLLLITGFCGGFTTFSAFSLETLELFQEGAWMWGGVNIVANLVGSIGACWLGFELARRYCSG